MSHSVSVLAFTGASTSILITSRPAVCPACHRTIDVRNFAGALTTSGGEQGQLVFQCPHPECRHLFIAYVSRTSPGGPYEIVKIAPQTPQAPNLPPEVAAISPSFLEIYSQALAAEAMGLDQIAGMALRKSVEFLVKDYAIHEQPSEADKIKKTALGKCIQQYVTDANVKACASRATWLGNDEAHYLRRWEGRDISDLKLLIRLSANWIENVLLTEKYISEMPEA